jgi:hypothetical protein
MLSYAHDANAALVQIGTVLRIQGDIPGALAAYLTGLVIDERLAHGAPDNAEVQRDLFVSLREVARLSARTGDCTAARMVAARAATQARLLVKRFPHIPRHENDLREGQELLGEIAELCP